MRIGKRLFPYPVLNSEKLYSQFKKSIFQLNYDEEVSEDKQFYLLKNIYCELDNPTLIDFINKDLAELVCIVECPSTMYRKKFILPLEPSDIQIDLADLNNKINVSAFIVAKEDIDEYKADDFIDDYSDITFSIEKHDILAADDGYINTVDFNDLDDDKQNSIFIIIKDKNISNGTMAIEYDSEKITISLPEEQWNYYEKSKKVPQFKNLYFSIIAIPSLGYAVSCLQKSEPSVDTLKIEYNWFNSFCEAYKKYHGEELDDDTFIKMNSNLEAQLIFDSPVTKAVDQLFDILNRGMGGNDDVD